MCYLIPTLIPYTTLFRSRDGPGARRRDSPVRMWRGHPASDDALRGELCVVGDLLHAFSRRSLSRRDRIGSHARAAGARSEEHTSELQSLTNLVCRLLLEK